MSTLEFNQLLISQMPILKSFALRFSHDDETIDDLTQDTLLKAMRYKNNFKPGTNLKAWLFTMMRNIFINQYNRKRYQNTIVDSTEGQFLLNSYGKYSTSETERAELRHDIAQAMDTISDKVKVPFEMFVEGWHYDEIAEKLDIPIGTVKSRIFQARKNLKQALQEPTAA
ncbi:MAG: RNA polymerase sigma factor [Flavobacteriales bacterium]|nr:RNA polymerase sigma factor [Flavobacteriales bacterium]